MDAFFDGNKLEFEKMSVSRASGAYNPDTGGRVANNAPRVTKQRIPFNSWIPKVYFSFSPSETKMEYDTTANNLLSREAVFEGSFAEFTKIQLGTSFQSRPIYAYRLGPRNRKHFIVTMAVHGNEIDGANGTFKAMEVLARQAEFKSFRDEWTILFVPAMNPDGWKLGTRNLAQLGPNGQTINLNRNYDWFWSEYVETPYESKGGSAESSLEAQALLNYIRALGPFVGLGAVTVGFVLDQHGNSRIGARFQSRDRVWRNATEGPGAYPKSSDFLPNGYLSIHADHQVWKMASALIAKRAVSNNVPENGVRYLRSRFLPRMHGYLSSIGTVAVAASEAKVDAAGGRETYQSAADFRLDYTLAAAACCTSDFWSWNDAVMVEKAGTNLIANAQFSGWPAGDGVPTNFTKSRSAVTRNQNIPEIMPASVKFNQDTGEAISVESRTDVVLTVASEYARMAMVALGRYVVASQAMTGLFMFDMNSANPTGYAGNPAIVLTKATRTGMGLAYAASDAVDMIGGGTAAPSTGAVTGVSRITGISTATPAEAAVGNINTARMFHAVADNFHAFPTAGNERAYIFGGYNGAGVRLTSIEIWNPNTNTSANKIAILPTATADSTAVYHPITNKVYIFGGSTGVSAAVDTIYIYDIAGDLISTNGTPMTVPLKHAAAAYNNLDHNIWIFGGEKSDGTMSTKIYVFNPTTGSFTENSTIQNLNDDEDTHDSEGELVNDPTWSSPIGRWGACLLVDVAGGTGTIVLAGGRSTDGAGTILNSIYLFDLNDEVIGLKSAVDFGSLQYTNLVVDTSYTTVFSDNFVGGILPANWSDPAAAWQDGGGFAQPKPASSGPLIVVPPVTLPMDALTVNIGITGTGIVPDMGLVLRGSYTGSSLTDGYRVRYTDNGAASQIWYLERLNASVVTSLTSLDVSGDGTKKVSNAMRSLTFKTEDRSPVLLTVVFNGFTIFEYYDLSVNRIKVAGKMSVFGGST